MKDRRLETLRNAVTAMAEVREVFGTDLTPDLVGELYAAEKLGLVLRSSKNARGFDAIDKEGKRYQVKYRAPGTLNIDVNNFDFDYLVLVNVDDTFELSGMWIATVAQAKEIFSSRAEFRKSQATQKKFKIIAARIT